MTMAAKVLAVVIMMLRPISPCRGQEEGKAEGGVIMMLRPISPCTRERESRMGAGAGVTVDNRCGRV